MAATNSALNEHTEYCDSCDARTAHEVAVELRTESSSEENSEFSREPYRVTECQSCGSTASQRMNNA